MSKSGWFATCMAVVLVGCAPSELELAVFEYVTSEYGLDHYTGMTHGVAWGDFDGDGLPDLYLTNHLNEVRLLRNQDGMRFVDVTADWLEPALRGGDSHGAAWADLNNNGRLDLVQLTGAGLGVGEEPKRLFLNRGDRLEDIAEQAGVDNPQGRTRMPLWLDLNRDGRLDLFHGAEARFDDVEPPFVFLQQGSRFEKILTALNFRSRSVPFCIVTYLINDHIHPQLVCRVAGQGVTAQVFDMSELPTRELDLLPITAFEDIAAGDFDNDGFIDLFLARKNPPGKVAFGRPSETDAIADIQLGRADFGTPQGFEFSAAGKLRVHVSPMHPRGTFGPANVRIGGEGRRPDTLAFELDPERAGGILEDEPTAGAEIRIGFEPPDRWRVILATVEAGADTVTLPRRHVQVGVSAADALSDLRAIGDVERPEVAPQRLFMNQGDELVEQSDKWGINDEPISAMNVVAADFNNDMHLDLFILASGDIGNHENVLLLNRGDGTFQRVAAAGGAAGPLSGVGDSVTTADVDGDGFLDLLIANGASMGRSLGLPSDNGGYRLYRNVGNANHWLQIDLEGTESNRDGIGARVFVTAGGVTQTRVQDGGVHHRGQNHSRLHFGLADHNHIDQITVWWPSGMVQQLFDLSVDQILPIRESGTLTRTIYSQ